MTAKISIVVMCLAAGCKLGPLEADPPDAGIPTDTPPPPPNDGGPPFVDILPPGTTVPSIDTNAELLVQIRINDGLVDSVLAANGGVVVRGTGKSAGATVRFWNFGPSPVDGTFNLAVAAPLYVFGTFDDANVFTPLPDHPRLIDTVPGDIRYSPMRRVVNVPVTSLYAGELITSLAALTEAADRGLIGEPVNDGTWVNMPVVLPGTTLEVGPTGADPLPTTKVFGRGYVVDVFELGTKFGRQPFRSGFLVIGQASGLQTGVPAGDGSLPTAIDPQLVFQFPIPTAPPTVFSYSPLATDVTVRLASGVAPSAVTADGDLFKRNATGAITGFFPAMVNTFTVGTTLSDIQIQFEEGLP